MRYYYELTKDYELFVEMKNKPKWIFLTGVYKGVLIEHSGYKVNNHNESNFGELNEKVPIYVYFLGPVGVMLYQYNNILEKFNIPLFIYYITLCVITLVIIVGIRIFEKNRENKVQEYLANYKSYNAKVTMQLKRKSILATVFLTLTIIFIGIISLISLIIMLEKIDKYFLTAILALFTFLLTIYLYCISFTNPKYTLRTVSRV